MPRAAFSRELGGLASSFFKPADRNSHSLQELKLRFEWIERCWRPERQAAYEWHGKELTLRKNAIEVLLSSAAMSLVR
jgi:hypothetical protein